MPAKTLKQRMNRENWGRRSLSLRKENLTVNYKHSESGYSGRESAAPTLGQFPYIVLNLEARRIKG
jgi:hypothetical protein